MVRHDIYLMDRLTGHHDGMMDRQNICLTYGQTGHHCGVMDR